MVLDDGTAGGRDTISRGGNQFSNFSSSNNDKIVFNAGVFKEEIDLLWKDHSPDTSWQTYGANSANANSVLSGSPSALRRMLLRWMGSERPDLGRATLDKVSGRPMVELSGGPPMTDMLRLEHDLECHGTNLLAEDAWPGYPY